MTAQVLVIEDNRANMELAALLLGHAGYGVLKAVTAADGIAMAREHLPDLILMDIQLPDMDGLEATRLLKADATTCDIKVVALTAYAMIGDEQRMLAGGCDGYIAKPLDYKYFLATVARLLGPAGAGG